MSNMQQYTKASVLLEGALLTEAATVTVHRHSGAQPVNTIEKGFAGISPGAASMEIDVSNAVPSADFERDPGQFRKKSDGTPLPTNITVMAAGKSLNTVGFLTEDDFSYATNQDAKLNFKALCKYAEWE